MVVFFLRKHTLKNPAKHAVICVIIYYADKHAAAFVIIIIFAKHAVKHAVACLIADSKSTQQLLPKDWIRIKVKHSCKIVCLFLSAAQCNMGKYVFSRCLFYDELKELYLLSVPNSLRNLKKLKKNEEVFLFPFLSFFLCLPWWPFYMRWLLQNSSLMIIRMARFCWNLKFPKWPNIIFHDSGNYSTPFSVDHIVGHIKDIYFPRKNYHILYMQVPSFYKRAYKEDRIECRIRYSRLDSTHSGKLSLGYFTIRRRQLNLLLYGPNQP